MVVGTCRLCLAEAVELQDSHYVPAALYLKRARLQFAGLAGTGTPREQVKAPLLCRRCEQAFDRNGESEVLRHVAPKSRKRFPLRDRMRVALPREEAPEWKRFAGYDLGLDMDRFAYFMLSLVWRGAVHQWLKPDGTLLDRLELGGFEEPIRAYLLGGPLPADTAVIVMVSSGPESRQTWFSPGQFEEANCLNFRFHALGIAFRAVMGRQLPRLLRESCCTSPRKPIFYGDFDRRTAEDWEALQSGPRPEGRKDNSSTEGAR